MAFFVALVEASREAHNHPLAMTATASVSAPILIHRNLRAAALPPCCALVPVPHRFASIAKTLPSLAHRVVPAEAFRLPCLNHAEVAAALRPGVVRSTCWWAVLIGAVGVVGVAVVGDEGGPTVVVHVVGV